MAHFQLAVECVTAMSLLIVLTQNLVFIERNQYSVRSRGGYRKSGRGGSDMNNQ